MTPITEEFEIASGSIIGQYHLRIGFNNQDNCFITENPHRITAVVCDGCGSSITSEVGSTLGSSMVAWELGASGIDCVGNNREEAEMCLERARRFIVDRITAIAFKVGQPFLKVITESFLFTIVAAVMGKDYTYVLSFGDGFYAINGQLHEIGPFENNAPPFIAYGAIEEHVKNVSDLKFVLHEIMPTPEVESLLLASDGLKDLAQAEEQRMPGKQELVGPVSQFWTDDLYFSNEVALSRKLAMVNRSVAKMDRQRTRLIHEIGYLKDDTTLVAIRRKL